MSLYRAPGFLFVFLLGLVACRDSKKETAFYYWKTRYSLNEYEKKALEKMDVKRIYLRAFDVDLVDWHSKPVGVMLWKDAPQPAWDYIPVVFIRNQVLKERQYNPDQLDDEQKKGLQILAANIWKLVRSSWQSQGLAVKELQIDCDWTRSTRMSYFYLLEAIRKEAGVPLSATLRLHQLRDRDSCGIPPVSSTVLMCYNMGNMTDIESRNSIIDHRVLQQYMKGHAVYPKSYALALPLFKWKLLFRRQKMVGIVHRLSDEDLEQYFVQNKQGLWECVQDARVYYPDQSVMHYQKGDMIRYERVSQTDIDSVYRFVMQQESSYNQELIYFDLDSTNLSHYDLSTLPKW